MHKTHQAEGLRSFGSLKSTLTVHMKFRVCFTLAKYENDMLSLCETTNVFIDAFCYSKKYFHQLESFKLIKNNVEIFKCL